MLILNVSYDKNTGKLGASVFELNQRGVKVIMFKLKLALFAIFLVMFSVGCSSSGPFPKLGEIRYNKDKDQTFIIDDWYRQEGAPTAKLGFWGRILKEGGRVKFQPVDRLANEFKIDRYPMRISPANHEEFKKLVVNVKNITLPLIFSISP